MLCLFLFDLGMLVLALPSICVFVLANKNGQNRGLGIKTLCIALSGHEAENTIFTLK